MAQKQRAEDARQTKMSGRVLVVDDSPQIRSAWTRLLRNVGYEVVEAESGRVAADLVQIGSFEVILSDVQMPDMNGVALLEAIRKADPDVSVLLVSGMPDLQTALKAVEYGALEYLTKPVLPDALVGSVERAAQEARRKREERNLLDSMRTGKRLKHQWPVDDNGWAGSLLAGKYRIGKLLGAGGMGIVYEAFREDLGQKPVAVKILRSGLASDNSTLQRFRREAETIASIDHQNIVQVFDFQANDEAPPFLVMERLHGRPLNALFDLVGSLDATRLVFIATQTLFALSAAHDHGIVHRDLKPENIFLTTVSGMQDIVKVLDFGIAKLLSADRDSRLTTTGSVVGTPAYMAPEQARGMPVDFRSDIYSLGCVLYEGLTGKSPHHATNYHALLVKIQEEEPKSLTEIRDDIPEELGQVIHKALKKNPAERYQSADEMLAAFGPWAPTSSRLPQPPTSRSSRTGTPTYWQLRTTRREDPKKK